MSSARATVSTNVPPLPATLAPGGSLVFTLIFNPTTAGAASGTLVIDSATFTLASVGMGASLVYSSLVGSISTVVQNAGTVVFPNTNVGSTSTISILVNNTGNSAATVSGIAVSGDGFSLPNLPKLPATINPGATLQFNVAFTAGLTASVTGVLQIDSVGINLRGNGNPPPSLSAVSFSNLPANASPRQQPVVSLAIAQPYPLDVTGKLTLTFASDSFADDPAIQFASGGRTVNFTIPAGTTDAVFSAANQVQLQTGTVAGVITLTANFSLASVDLTPNPAPSAKMVVTAGPPQLTAVQIGARTTNSFELLITGLSTPRQVSQIGLQFTPDAGNHPAIEQSRGEYGRGLQQLVSKPGRRELWQSIHGVGDRQRHRQCEFGSVGGRHGQQFTRRFKLRQREFAMRGISRCER